MPAWSSQTVVTSLALRSRSGSRSTIGTSDPLPGPDPPEDLLGSEDDVLVDGLEGLEGLVGGDPEEDFPEHLVDEFQEACKLLKVETILIMR